MTILAKANSTGSHRLAGQARAVFSSDTEIHVSKDGNDVYNNGTSIFPYKTVGRAFTDVTATRKVVYVGSGEFDETGLTWPTVNGVQLIGVGNRWQTVLLDSLEGAQVLAVAPGVQTSTYEMTIQNIQINHDNSGQDGLKLTHTDVAKKMNVYLGNFGCDGGSSDLGILVVHGGSGNAVRIYWDGGNGTFASAIDLDSEDGGDKFFVSNVDFEAGIDAGAADTTQEIKLSNCQVLANAAFSGGGATGIVNLISCWSKTGTTFAICDAADVTTASSLTNPVITGG